MSNPVDQEAEAIDKMDPTAHKLGLVKVNSHKKGMPNRLSTCPPM